MEWAAGGIDGSEGRGCASTAQAMAAVAKGGEAVLVRRMSRSLAFSMTKTPVMKVVSVVWSVSRRIRHRRPSMGADHGPARSRELAVRFWRSVSGV